MNLCFCSRDVGKRLKMIHYPVKVIGVLTYHLYFIRCILVILELLLVKDITLYTFKPNNNGQIVDLLYCESHCIIQILTSCNAC